MRLARLWPLLAAMATLLALPAFAHADTYCVNSPGCTGTSEPDLQSALSAAMSTTTVSDTVQVGDPGPPPSSGYGYSDGGNAANQVTIVGGGQASTVLSATNPGGTILAVIGAGSSISKLSIQIHAGNSGTGIATSGSVSDVNITTADTGGSNQTGISVLGGNQQFNRLNVTLATGGAGNTTAVAAGTGNNLTVQDSSFVANNVDFAGPFAASLTLQRVSLVGQVGVEGTGSNFNLDNVSFRQLPGSGAPFVVDSPDASHDAVVTVDHFTGFGNADPNSIGVLSTSSSAGRTQTTTVRNSIIRNFGHALLRQATNGTANLTVSYSDFSLPNVIDTNAGGAGSITTGAGNLLSDPMLANPAAGDFHLLSGSPAIDAGDPAGIPPGESTTDVLGQPRLSGPRVDMGAIEVQQPPPPATPASPPPDKTPPNVAIARVKARLKLSKFLKGFRFSLSPSEPSSFDVTLAGSVRSAHLSKSFNLILAHKKLGLAAGRRTVTLKVKKRLLGRSRRFSVKLTVVATDAAGNKRTVTRTFKVSG